MRRIAEDGRYAAGVPIGVDEGRSVEAIASGPSDLEAGVGFLEGDGFRVAVAGEAGGEAIGGVEEPSIACFGREQDKLVDGDDASVMSGGPSLDGANLVGESKPRAVAHSFAPSGLDRPLREAKRWTGTVTLPCEERERSTPYGFSSRRDGLAPRGHRRGA